MDILNKQQSILDNVETSFHLLLWNTTLSYPHFSSSN